MTATDRPPSADPDEPEITESRRAEVAGAEVRRALPRRARRTVGAWCFADHFGPATGGVGSIGPHPHIGLQTVTWLLEGELLHRDSVGSEQLIRPGQLNLMTAGHGVVHAEESDTERVRVGHGVQLWVAQPAATRDGPAAFEHHAELPEVDLGGATASVLVGELLGSRSPARADTDHLGFQLALRARTEVPLESTSEHAVIALDGPVELDGRPLAIGQVAYLAPGRDQVTLEPREPGRILVVGGTPFEARVHMWWNFVALDRDDLTAAYHAWHDETDRFGPVDSVLPRVPAPRPPWLPEAPPHPGT